MFVFIYNNFSAEFTQQILILLFKLKSYENYFDSNNAKMFFTHENENHVISLKFNKKSSYDFLYALSKKKFQIL